MNTYDFDGTLYRGDSTIDFFKFSIRARPRLLRYIPVQLAGALAYAAGTRDMTYLKEKFFAFFRGMDAAGLAGAFWDERQGNIFPWYLAKHRRDDIILSASPEFLLRPICERLGVRRLIASRVDPASGKFDGRNCRGDEKVRRLESEFGVTRVDEFYSDSMADAPMAGIADRAFLVRNGTPREWPRKTPTGDARREQRRQRE